MARLHNGFDVYIGEDLTFTMAQLIENHHEHRLVVKTRSEVGGLWSNVLILVDTTLLTGLGVHMAWDGTDEATGETLRVSAVRRDNGGCSSCGGGSR